MLRSKRALLTHVVMKMAPVWHQAREMWDSQKENGGLQNAEQQLELRMMRFHGPVFPPCTECTARDKQEAVSAAYLRKRR